MKTEKDAPTIDVDPDEWNFAGITNRWELPFATIYEYARSNQPLRGALSEWFNAPFWKLGIIDKGEELLAQIRVRQAETSTIGDVLERIYAPSISEELSRKALALLGEETPAVFHQQRVLSVALRFPRFPEPWMSMRRMPGIDYLKRRCFAWPEPKFPLVDLSEVLIEDPFFMSRFGHAPANFERCEFVIDWSASSPLLAKAFKSWLRKRHPSGRGRRDRGDPLKWLGAFRLREESNLGRVELLDGLRKTRGSKICGLVDLPRYGSEKKFYEAAKKGEALIHGNFGEELPRRFGRLWFV